MDKAPAIMPVGTPFLNKGKKGWLLGITRTEAGPRFQIVWEHGQVEEVACVDKWFVAACDAHVPSITPKEVRALLGDTLKGIEKVLRMVNDAYQDGSYQIHDESKYGKRGDNLADYLSMELRKLTAGKNLSQVEMQLRCTELLLEVQNQLRNVTQALITATEELQGRKR
jgi:hypothetical protein